MLTDPYSRWKNAAEGSWRDILGVYEKILSIRVCQNDCFPISLIGAETPAMKLHCTSYILTVRRHGIS